MNILLQLIPAKDSWSSSVTLSFLAVRTRDTTEFSWMADAFPGRKCSSVLSRLSFRWYADIH